MPPPSALLADAALTHIVKGEFLLHVIHVLATYKFIHIFSFPPSHFHLMLSSLTFA
jgi:hypothetical protein